MFTLALNRLSSLIFFLAIIIVISLSSCLDDEGFIDSLSIYDIHKTENSPTIVEADAMLTACRRVALVEQSGFNVFKTIGEANAFFIDEGIHSHFISVGKVNVNGIDLNISKNNEYSYQIDLTNEAGHIFNDKVRWEIEGTDKFKPLTKSIQIWPEVGDVNSPKIIETEKDYELSIEYIHNAHAVCFQISSIKTLLKEQKDDIILSHNFPASEVIKLGHGPGIVQINAYYINDTIINGKNIYFVNSEASYEVVEIR